MLADIEEMENLDASEIHPRKLNAKVIFLYSRSEMEQSDHLEEVRFSEPPS